MKRTALSVAAAIALMGAGAANAATTAQLEQKLDAMAAQIEALKAELKEVKAQNATLATQQQTQAKAQAQQTAALQDVQQTVQTAQLTISQNDVLTAIDIVALVASGMRRN